MINLDTNFLVRLIVEDDPGQTADARLALGGAVERGETCLVTVPVLCELLWVLKRGYKVPPSELLEVVEELLEEGIYEVEHEDSVRRALERFRTGRGDFADYLIDARGVANGSRTTWTFDRGLDEEGFTVL